MLVLVTNCVYGCMCHPSPSPSKYENTKKKWNQAHKDAFIYNIWEKSIGKLKIFGALSVFNWKITAKTTVFPFICQNYQHFLIH